MRFALLSHWVQDCNTNHSQCGRKDTDRPVLPTRLIDVGRGNSRIIESNGSETVRLIFTPLMTEDDLKADTRYIALSHPWGSARHHNHFCTTRQNLASRIKDGIAIADLPATLRDAVTVTRALGVRYLWIDDLHHPRS